MRKVVLITGASRGIGRACALLAAGNGWDVVVNFASNKVAAFETIAAVEAVGQRALAVQGDVGSEADVLRLYDAVDRFGTLDALVNNAGVVDQPARVDEMSLARLERMFRINVTGSFLCAREAIRRMSTRHGGKGGTIVNLGSMASVLGAPGQYVDYAAAKGAIDAMTVGLGRELAGEGIRVNAVRPGIIDTEIHASGGIPDRVERLRDQIPMKRAGIDMEVAEAVIWLMGEASSYTTGSVITVAGGR